MVRTFSWVTLALALFTAAPAEAYQPLWYRTGLYGLANAHRIAAGDFNGDGRPDVITLVSATSVRLFVTNAEGTLATPTIVYSGTNLLNLLVTDVNADGKVDVILGQRTPNALIVLLSNGDGTFVTPITTAVAIDPTPGRFAIADFNGDSKIDVVMGSYYDLAVAIHAGDGAGNFALLLNRSVPSAPAVVAAGDLDADGKADYAVGYADGTPYEVHFGNGDGTFAATYPLSGVPTAAARMVFADLDGDNDREIIVPHYETHRLTVNVNTGSRTFAPPVFYDVLPTPSSGSPWDIAVADVDGDGNNDVVLSLSNPHFIATYTGNGDGTLDPGAYVPAGSYFGGSYSPRQLAVADFTGDGRVDIALAASVFVALWKNVSGDVTVVLSREFPTISAGQSAKFEVSVANAQADFYSQYLPPAATGTVTLTENGVQIGSGTVNNSVATIEVPSLAPGMHTITAHYSGDDSYRATDSAPVQQNVTAATTTVTLTNSASGELAYWQPFLLTAKVTSAIPERLDGILALYRNGDFVRSGPGPQAYFDGAPLPPGTYTYRVEYRGTETQPPSTSEVITQVIVKAGSSTGLGDAQARYGQQTAVGVTVTGAYGGSPSGAVRLYEGATLIGTVVAPVSCCAATVVQVPVALPVGVHYLRAEYEGNANYESSTSGVARYSVVPDEGFVIDAYSNGTAIIARGVYAAPNGGHFKIYRRTGTTGWVVFQASTPQWIEENAAASTPYTFRMEVYDASNQLVASSNTDTAMRVSFTDDPLMAATIIKSVHLAELVMATNALRSAAGLGAISITTSAGQLVRATHLLQLRTAINEARVALGADAVAFTGNVASDLPVRASHIQELRDAIR